MGFNFEPFIALRYLRSKRKEVFISIITVISVFGVAISVMVLNIVLAVMTGFESELQAKLINANAHLVIRDYRGYLQNWQPLAEQISKNKNVTSAFPYTYNQAMLSTPAGARGLVIRGVPNSQTAKEKLKEVNATNRQIENLFNPVEISVDRPDGSSDVVSLPAIIIGEALSRALKVGVGDVVSLFSPELSASPHGLIPRVKRFSIVGVYHSGLVEYEGGLAYVSIDSAQSFFSLNDTVSGIEVSVKDIMKAYLVGEELLGSFGTEQSHFYATDWTEPNKPLWDALKLEKRVYFIVLLLLIFVASFSVISTLVMVVMEKNKDIAILKSMGATDKSISKIFLIQGTIIGFLGVILGTFLGVVGCILLREYGFEIDQTVFALDKVPVHMIPANFLLVAVAGFIITSLAGIYPARRAAKLDPVATLRFE
jgi:lipoprotein-releasing system permease protein